MFYIIITLISLIVAVVGAYIAWYVKRHKNLLEAKGYYDTSEIRIGGTIAAMIGLAVATVATGVGSFYTQDPGQASVIVSFTGKVEGINYAQGFQVKEPWARRVEYDIRNNTLSYIATGESDNNGGNASGPQITFQDADGVTGNIDVNVRYSIRGDAVQAIYEEYKTQPEFVNATLANDVRSQTREIASKYHTLDLFSNRDTIKNDLISRLQEKWDKLGVDVEDVYLQEVRYSDEIKATFDEAQNARTKVETAKADQERAKIEAETNKIKTKQLSKEVLTEKLIDAIKNGNGTYIIDTKNISVGVK